MKFLHAIMVILLILGCTADPIDLSPTQPVAPISTPEPEVDRTFMNQMVVDAWRDDIAEFIEGEVAIPHPRDIWRYADDFKVDSRRIDPILGDPSIWDAARVADPGTDFGLAPEVPLPRADEALALEAHDEEWAAADIWIILGRLDDAKRCSKLLEEEGEWKAVAMIAVHTGDLTTLDRATKRMVEANQIKRTMSVAEYAFQQGKVEVTKHITQTHGWELSDVLNSFEIRELAFGGDTSLLIETLDQEIAAWESGQLWSLAEYPPPVTIVADIVILGKTDKAMAREYAARYLGLNTANVFLWIECGEGCYSDPVHGTLELYQLIAQNKVLRKLYFARLRAAMDDIFPRKSEGAHWPQNTILGAQTDALSGFGQDMWGYDHNIDGNHLFAYLQRVRKIGDRELTTFWVEMLDTFPARSTSIFHRSLAFEREVGLAVLGRSFNKSVVGITFTEKFILDELSGGAERKMEEVWAAWDKQLPTRGHKEDVSYLFRFLTRGTVATSREAVIRNEIGVVEQWSLQYELRLRFDRSLDAHYGQAWVLGSKFDQAKRALEINVKAQIERQELGLPVIDIYPDTQSELDELVAPSLAFLCEKLPAQCRRWRPLIPEPEIAVTAQSQTTYHTP